jgi:hypothetical protein
MPKLLILFCLFSLSTQASNDGLLLATGFGTVDLTTVQVKSQGTMMAKRAAMLDAQRNLSEQIKGVRLTGGTTMQDYEISSDIVATRVKGFLKGAFEHHHMVTETQDSISVELILAVCLSNQNEICKGKETLSDLKNEIKGLSEKP